MTHTFYVTLEDRRVCRPYSRKFTMYGETFVVHHVRYTDHPLPCSKGWVVSHLDTGLRVTHYVSDLLVEAIKEARNILVDAGETKTLEVIAKRLRDVATYPLVETEEVHT